MLRFFLFFVDLIIFGGVILGTITNLPNDANQYWGIAGICVLLILHLVYIFFSKKDKESFWITLYFKRKRLEEKKKIETLSDELRPKM